MSTTTLQTFERGPGAPADSVILWWGPEIRILHPDGALASRRLAKQEDPVAAILAMATGAARVRIAYHPASVETHDISCAVAERGRLLRRLSREYPSLKAAGTLWAVDAMEGRADRAGSVLYVDRRSALPRLVDGLTRAGIQTVGAWPIRCLVEAAGPVCAGREISWAVVAVPGRALVTGMGPNGSGFARHHEGAGAEEDAMADINTILALLESGEDGAGLCAFEEGGGMEGLFKGLGGCKVAKTTIAGLLEGARLICPGGPSDFLQGRRRFPDRRCLSALAVGLGALMLAASALSARSTLAARERVRLVESAAIGHRAQMRASLKSRRVIHDEIDRQKGELAQLQVGTQREYDLLMALCANIPRQVELFEVSTQSGTFTVRGRCEAGSADPGDILGRFRRNLEFKGAPWTLSGDPMGEAGPDFAWHGSFR